MQDISVTGVSATIFASLTFPTGFTVTAWADDANPIDVETLQIGDTGMGVNGDLVTWSTPSPIRITLRPIPNSEGDANLQILLSSNRVAKNKTSVQDIITMVVNYPDSTVKTFTNGKLINGTPALGVASNARLQTREYQFVFENQVL